MISRQTGFTETKFFTIAFVFSVAILFTIAAISFNQLRQVNNARKNIIISRERQIELEKLFSNIKDAESMQRGYIITGEKTYLDEYKASYKKVSGSLSNLRALTNDVTLKRQEVDTLSSLIKRRLHHLDSVLKLYSPSTSSSALNKALQPGASEMRKIDLFIKNIIHSENKELNKYEAYHKTTNSFLPYTTALLVIFASLIFFISFYKINRDAKRNRKINEDLMIVNQSFQYAEEISQMGHWKRNLLNNEIIASDNMYRLFGIEPGTAPFGEDILLKFVHPEDKEALLKSLEKIKRDHTPPDMTYRIIDAKGNTRHLKSAGKFVTINKTPMILGSTCDVTRHEQINRSIEEKNNELEVAVEELASFNHIASHDLQEPLRKIQMFISRIATEEAATLSQTGLEYFDRISASALWMEQLIDDLLFYSETNKDEQVFRTIDLNEILADAQQELATKIQEKKATIKSDVLPVISTIPFQMRQLFINLLSNALKYSNPDVIPSIIITCTTANSSDLNFLKNAYPAKYYKIAIKDNGIGFKQEFAEKIFVLFQRLHKKEKYSGTGIGLAICKKIIERHKGLITAESNPGEGATFTIFLPR